MTERKLDWRPDYDLDTEEEVSSNYYPITQGIAMRDVT